MTRGSLALTLALALCGCGGLLRAPGLPPVESEGLDRPYTLAELAEDVDWFFATLEEVHPDPYRAIDRETMLERRRALVAGFDRPHTRRELQPRLAELVALLGDGHTSLYAPYEEFWRDEAEQGCFPIDVEWDGRFLVVRHTAVVTEDGALGVGARLLMIGGQPAGPLVERYLARQSGESEAWRISGVESSFPVHLWLDGLGPPFRVHAASALDPARELDVEVPGMRWGSVVRGATPGGGETWRLERRPDGAALLVLDSLAGSTGDFEDFLEESFEALAAQPPSALVIDLRRNGGGDSRVGDELLQYLSDRPWRQAARKEWKVSEPLKRHLKSMLPGWIGWMPVQYLHPMGWTLWGTEDGGIAVFEEERVEPRDEPLRYRGPLAWLIGPQTFSAAMGLAAGAQDCGCGLLVGRETGGPANGFGEVIGFRLPHTQLGLQISSAYFVRCDGDRSVRGGVRPDVEAWPEPGEAGDPVLATAIAELATRDQN